MLFKISEYVDVKKKAEQLGFDIPTGIALLPQNFDIATSKGQLVHESTTQTVRVLWRQNGIIETALEHEEDKIPTVAEKSLDWVGPTIFISALYLSQNSKLVSLAIDIIANYLADFFRGIPKRDRKIKISFITETKDGCYKRIEYEGPPEKLRASIKEIQKISNE